MFKLVIPFLLSLFLSIPAQSQELDFLSEDLFGEESFLPVKEAFQPSLDYEGADLVVHWDMAPEYYLYQERFEFNAPGQSFGAPVFEPGLVKQDDYYEKLMEVYYDATTVRMPDFQYSGPLEVISQGCADAGLCYAPTSYWFEVDSDAQTAYPIDAPANVTSEPLSNTSTQQPSGEGRGAGSEISLLIEQLLAGKYALITALVLTFVGGLILNLMPCVFPVLAIKALKISTGGMSPLVRLKDSAAYTAGIVFTTVCIAAVMLALRAGGSQIGWGFQLQSPSVVTFLIYLFFVVGLSFSGWIMFGARFAGIGQNLISEGKPFQSFFTGMLAMIVASPCSAPFMAVTMGYAVSQPAWVALLIFSFLGLGMAFPLVLLNSLPALSNRMPRPGPWMETLKEFLAFPMYLTSAWLLWVLIAQVGATGASLVVAGLCTLAAMFWGFKQENSKVAAAFAIVMLATTSGLVWKGVTTEKPAIANTSTNQAFELSTLDSKIGGDRPVFLDVTADWCITCKFNESRVLYSAEIQEIMAQQNVIYLVADWTNDNPEISKLLERYNRVGIPLYLYFPAGSTDASVLPQILTKDIMRSYLL